MPRRCTALSAVLVPLAALVLAPVALAATPLAAPGAPTKVATFDGLSVWSSARGTVPTA